MTLFNSCHNYDELKQIASAKGMDLPTELSAKDKILQYFLGVYWAGCPKLRSGALPQLAFASFSSRRRKAAPCGSVMISTHFGLGESSAL